MEYDFTLLSQEQFTGLFLLIKNISTIVLLSWWNHIPNAIDTKNEFSDLKIARKHVL